ncbi:hypothetical protein N602_30070 [Mycobacterium avium subsp. hominissuis 10-5606]|nr:hypothetical protein N602_30070 [Mycobacterium avium subsp. hominissuis 10-5606]
MAGQRPELVVGPRTLAFTENQLRQPLCVEPARPDRGGGLLPQTGVRLGQITRRGEVRVDRLAGDEQPHDLAGALEDAVDPQIAQHLLDGRRPFAARANDSAVS